jgi:hypothetical protein
MVKRTISHYCAAVKVCVMALAGVSKCFFLQNISKSRTLREYTFQRSFFSIRTKTMGSGPGCTVFLVCAGVVNIF